MNERDAEKGVVAKSAITGAEALGVAFVVLKLIGIIEWSWFWVTAPFWMPFALIVVILIAVMVIMMIKEIFS